MPRKHIILHIGLPKTGTTAIQRSFGFNTEHFSKLDVLYPTNGQSRLAKRMRGHHNLAYELYDPNKYSASNGSWADMAEEINQSEAKNVVISSEAFRPHLAKVTAAKLRKLFPTDRRTIVIYLRPQWEYVESGYNQLARFAAIDDSIETFWQNTGRKISDYQSVVSAWQEAAHDCEVICLPFGKEARRIGIVEHFCQNILGHGAGLEQTDQVNSKIGLRALSAIYYCRNEYRKVVKDRSAKLPSATNIQLSHMFKGTDDFYDFTFISPDFIREVYESSIETNRWMASQYPQFDIPEFLEPPSPSKSTYVDKWPKLSPEECAPLRLVIREAVAMTREERLKKAAAEAEAEAAMEDSDD